MFQQDYERTYVLQEQLAYSGGLGVKISLMVLHMGPFLSSGWSEPDWRRPDLCSRPEPGHNFGTHRDRWRVPAASRSTGRCSHHNICKKVFMPKWLWGEMLSSICSQYGSIKISDNCRYLQCLSWWNDFSVCVGILFFSNDWQYGDV